MSRMKFGMWAAVALILVPLAVAQSYTLTDLGTFGGTNSYATAINDHGEVVGYAQESDGNQIAFIWTATGGLHSLGTLSGYSSSGAQGINNLRQVVGWLFGSAGSHAFVWTKSGGMKDLGTLGGGASTAYGINNSGEVVGYSRNADGNLHAFAWTESGGMKDLGTLGGNVSEAWGINDFGEVVGYSSLAGDSTYHAFLWTQASGMQDLGTLGDVASSVALAVSGSGQVVGYAFTPYRSIAFDWNQNHGMQSLNVGTGSGASAINAANEVVGWFEANGTSAFLWTPAQHAQNLNSLIPPNSGWFLSSAFGINRSGQIAAWGEIGGAIQAVLLTPSN
jgi:probable HAF family extracellular repeat protein